VGILCGYVPQDAALNWVQNGGPKFQFPLTIRQETLTSGVILGTVTIAFLVSLCTSVSIHGMKRAKTLEKPSYSVTAITLSLQMEQLEHKSSVVLSVHQPGGMCEASL